MAGSVTTIVQSVGCHHQPQSCSPARTLARARPTRTTPATARATLHRPAREPVSRRQAQPTTARNNPSLHVGPTSMLPSMDLPCHKEGYASTITLSRIRPPKPAVPPQRLLHPQTHHHILFSRSHTATKSSATAHVVNTGYCSTIYPSLPRIPTRPRLLLVWPLANAGFGVYVCRARQRSTLQALSPPGG
jgi:hypothetical protein